MDSSEVSNHLFQNDTLLSDQHRETFQTRALDPEKRLMLALLEDAVKSFQAWSTTTGREDLALMAEEWIFAEDPEWPFSFENVCEYLDIDPVYLRKGLLRWKKTEPRSRKGRLTQSAARSRQRCKTKTL